VIGSRGASTGSRCWFRKVSAPTVEPEKGGSLIYPKGDLSARPSGHMPKDGFFFDAVIRQKPLRPRSSEPDDNAEQYQPLTEAQLDDIEQDARVRSKAASTRCSRRW